MPDLVSDKIALLRERLLAPEPPIGALLVVYPPEEERAWEAAYAALLQELQAQGRPVHVVDLRTMLFEVLEKAGLLDKSFRLDAASSSDAFRNLADLAHRELVRRLRETAAQQPEVALCCRHSAALYPWISYSRVLDDIEGQIANPLVIPFPGTANGPTLFLLNQKQGYNYRAARI